MPNDSGSPDLATLFANAEACAKADPKHDSEERWQAIANLQERTEPAVFERAVLWCSAEDAITRCLGADTLAKLGWQDDCPFSDRSEAVLTPLLHDADEFVVASTLHAHGFLGLGDSKDLQAFAKHESADVRHALAGCLGGREDDCAHSTLIELSSDPDHDVRDWATFGLGTQCDADTPAIRDALLARLEDEHDDTRCEAMVGLAQRGEARAAPFIEKELENDAIGQLAIDAAALLGDPRFLPHLQSLLEDNPGEERLREAVASCSPH